MFLELSGNSITPPTPAEVVEALNQAFRGLASGASVQPAQTVILLPDGAGDCIIYSAYVGTSSAIGIKVSPYLPARAARGEAPVTAYTLILDATLGTPIALVDSLKLTTERTAATTLLGVQQLTTGTPPAVIAVVGTGAVGRCHARYAADLFPSAQTLLFSPTAVTDAPAGEERRKLIASEIPGATVAVSLDKAVGTADVVMICTSSGTPVVDIDRLRADVVVTSIGTNAADAHEIDWRRLPDLDVYCDYRLTCPGTAGDMKLAQVAGVWDAHAICADLPELLTGAMTSAESGRRFFRSTGLGLEDVTIAGLIARR